MPDLSQDAIAVVLKAHQIDKYNTSVDPFIACKCGLVKDRETGASVQTEDGLAEHQAAMLWRLVIYS